MGYMILKIFPLIWCITFAGAYSPLQNTMKKAAVRFRCDYKYHGIGWFKYHEIPLTWHDARLECHLEGATLASPTTTAIKSKMISLMSNKDIFIGIHSTFSKGHYYSVSGKTLDQIPHTWADSEPDNKNNSESCLVLNSDGAMADVDCNIPRPFICYRENSSKDVNICGTIDPEYHFDGRTNKCYKFHTTARVFEKAHFACSAEGGHLAIINSDQESKVLVDIFAKYPESTITGTLRRDIAIIGFHNWGDHLDWTTIHGQTLQEAGYAKFAAGEPNSLTEECGSIYRNGLMNDLLCNSPFPFICEKTPDYPPICNSSDEEFIFTLN